MEIVVLIYKNPHVCNLTVISFHVSSFHWTELRHRLILSRK